MRALSRRQFLVRGTGLGAGIIGVLLSIPALGFLLSPLFEKEKIVWLTVGSIDGIKPGEPTALTVDVPNTQGWPTPAVPRVVYVVRKSDGSTLALSNICTHMQCDVHWDRRLGQFLCPCHGGLYDLEGNNVGGPPPQPLAQWINRIRYDAATGEHILEIQNQLNERI